MRDSRPCFLWPVFGELGTHGGRSVLRLEPFRPDFGVLGAECGRREHREG